MAEVLKYIKYSNDKDVLKKVLENDKVYESIDRETAELIRDVTGSDLKFEDGKEMVNMCKATEDMKKEAEEKGKKIGEKKGANDRAIEIAKAMLARGKDSVEEIAALTKLSVDDIKGLTEEV